MSSLPPPEEIAGPYLQQYEVYYKRLDPEGKGEIGAMDAAGFLKKSKLPDETLGKIWDIADYQSKGVLDKAGFFVACKMVALVQSDQPLTVDNARVEAKAPNFGPVETAPGAPTAPLPGTEDGPVPVKNALNFLVKPEEKRKYDTLFDQLQPQDGKIGGDKVRNVMMGSKLPTGILGNIWDLSDVDRDGMLDRYEFTVAMHLVYRALQGDKIPDQLPDELSPEKVPKPLSALPNLNGTAKPPVQAAAAPQRVEVVPWVVNSGEKLRFNNLFKQTDTDGDGFVSGVEIKNVFLQTGLPQNILAHIWNLCDMKQEGKLNPEQFCLAMWLINRKQSGKDPPAALTPDMVPPSMRPKGQDAGTANSVYNNPELEMIAKDIQSLLSEKIQLEKESQDAEYNLSVKNTEFHSLQSEFDTLSSTLKQLTNQKNVAQKRLDDLDSQKSSLEEDFQKLLDRIEEENQKIEKLRSQADEQEATLVAQEEEVQGKQKELEKLKQEEQTLLEDIKKSEKEIELLERDLGVANELTSEVTEQLENLTEAESHMTKANDQFQTLEAAGEDGDYSCIPDPFLEPLRLNLEEPDFTRLERKPEKPPVPEPPVQMNGSMSDSDHFGGTSPAPPSQQVEWGASNAFSSSGFDAFNGGQAEHNPQDGDHPPPLVPRPDSGDSPTPALPPKSSTAPPRRPPPPKRPPPPGGASKAAPPVPPPPQANSDDPFGAKADDGGGGGGFADFANFDSQFNFGSTNLSRQGGGFNAQWDTAFGASDGDSALGSSTDPTPTHRAKSTLEFDGDPFKDSEHRYGDPFGLEGADPVEDSFDPFAAEVNEDTIEDVFGTWRMKKQKERGKVEDLWANSFDARPSTPTAPPRPADPFSPKVNDPFQGSGSGADPFAAISSSSFKAGQPQVSANLDDSFDPFSLKNQKRQEEAAAVAPSSSVFGSDPFQPSPQPPAKPPPPKLDPFGAPAGRPTAPTAVDFDSVFGKPFIPTPAKNNANKTTFPSGGFDDSFSLKTSNKLPPNKSLQKSETVSNVPNAGKTKKSASSLSRPWIDSGASSAGESSNKGGGLKLLGIGGMKDGGDKGEKGEKKKKSSSTFFRRKNVDKSQSAVDLSYLGTSGALATSVEDTQIKMASEASKRAEEDRMRRLRLQEERELAYAIALSKAEAVSLKNK